MREPARRHPVFFVGFGRPGQRIGRSLKHMNQPAVMKPSGARSDEGEMTLALTRDLCQFETGVVADGNEALFARLNRELSFKRHSYKSGDTFNGWSVPDNWRVKRAEIRRDGKIVFDGRTNALGVARYAKSFRGILDWEELRPHLVTNPDLPDAFVFHCMWQYRPWAADWALSVPYNVFKML